MSGRFQASSKRCGAPSYVGVENPALPGRVRTDRLSKKRRKCTREGGVEVPAVSAGSPEARA